jgi:hypothetical protein
MAFAIYRNIIVPIFKVLFDCIHLSQKAISRYYEFCKNIIFFESLASKIGLKPQSRQKHKPYSMLLLETEELSRIKITFYILLKMSPLLYFMIVLSRHARRAAE